MTLLGLILLLVVLGAILYVIQVSSLDQNNKNILRTVLIVVLVIWLIYALAPGFDFPLFKR